MRDIHSPSRLPHIFILPQWDGQNHVARLKSLNTTEMLEIIRDEYPNVTVTTKAKVELGRALVSLEYERKDHSHVAYYKAVPLKAA